MSFRTRLLAILVTTVFLLTTLPNASSALRTGSSSATERGSNFDFSTKTTKARMFVDGSGLLAPTASQLWYNGDSAGASALPNGITFSHANGRIYSDFNVTSADGWEVSGVFSNNLMSTVITQASYEIRSGVSLGNPGTLLHSGTTAATQVATGRSLGGFTEYRVTVSGLSIHLAMGTYFLNVAPIGNGTGVSYNTATTGANAVGSPPGNNGNEFWTSGTTNFGNTAPQGNDFSNGVIGNVTVLCAPPAIVYVDDNWAGTPTGDDPDGIGPATYFGCDSFATIQGGVNRVATGGQVLVGAGTYNEAQITILRSMTVTGAGAATTTINGGNSALTIAGLVRIVTPLGDTGSVTFSGFTITNPGLSSETAGTHITVYARPLDPAATTTVSNNTILGVNAADNGFYTIRNVGSVVYHNNLLTNQGYNPIVIERAGGPTDVHHNTISAYGFTAYFNFTYAGTNVTSLQRVADNTIDASTASAIAFNSAFPAAPPFTGIFTNVSIVNNTITNLGTNMVGITVSNRAGAGAGSTGDIQNPVISGNIITGTDAAGSRGIRLNGLVTNAAITSNDVRHLERSVSAEVSTDHAPTGTQAHFNNFVSNAGGFVSNAPSSTNAENNWWGCNAGPGNAGCDSVTGNVDFDPWLVLGISASPNPIVADGSTTVTADMTHNSDGTDTSASGTVPLTPVTFSATNGSMSPPAGTITAGQASSTFTSNSSSNGSACATVDNQLICTDVIVVSPVTVSLPHVTGPSGAGISVPMSVGDLTGKGVKSYTFQVTFDPTRVQPQAVPYDTTFTLSSGMVVTFDTTNAGHLIISASQATDLAGSGTLISLLFNIVGLPGRVSPLSFQDYTDPGTIFHPGFRFNTGAPEAITSNGSIHINGPTAAEGTVSGRIVDNDGNAVEGAAIRLDGTQNRLTVTDHAGNYRFDNVETDGFYTVTPSRANFLFSPTQRSFSQLGQNTEAVFVAANAASGLNPLDTTVYFVRQQYLDFLSREPDEAGLNFWVNNINACGSDIECVTAKRIDTSAAFFLSIEFQQTGYLVHRMYQTAFGDMQGAPVPVRLSEFTPDKDLLGQGVVVNQKGWEAKLEANTKAFASAYVQRARFKASYPEAMTPAEFVDRLFLNAAATPEASERAAVVAEFGDMTNTADSAARARALRRVADSEQLRQQEFSQAFVLMQYFGYLGRDPNTGADANFAGYNFWLGKLESFNGNYRNAEMVKAFLLAGEYRGRFPR